MKIFKYISPALLFWLIIFVIFCIYADNYLYYNYDNIVKNKPGLVIFAVIIITIQSFIVVLLLINIIIKFNKFLNKLFHYKDD